MYLTPGQFRALNFGVPGTADMIDAELAPILLRASADADAYCLVPRNHSFFGGVVVGETHVWSISPYDPSPQRRVFPKHRPVLSIQSMHIHVTEGQYLNFDNAELHYEPSEGFIEPASASLTSYGLFGSSVLPFVGLTQPYAKIDYTYGERIVLTQQAFYQGEGGMTWRAQTGFWTLDDVTVKINGTTVTTGFTLNRREGTITWTTGNPNGTDDVEVTFTTSLQPDISLATGIIAAARLSDRKLLADGMPLGVRAFRVAEVSVERDLPRRSSGAYEPPSIPAEAADKLDPFRFYYVRVA